MKKKRKYLKFLLIVSLVLCMFFCLSIVSNAQIEIEDNSYYKFNNSIANVGEEFESYLDFKIQNDEKVYNGIYVYQSTGLVQIIYAFQGGSKIVYNNGWISQDYRYIVLLPQTIDAEGELAFNFIDDNSVFGVVLLPYTYYTFNVGMGPEDEFAINATFSTIYSVPSNLLNDSSSPIMQFDRIGYSGEQERVTYSAGNTIFTPKPDDNSWVNNYRSIIFDRQEISYIDYENLLSVGVFGTFVGDQIIIDNDNIQSQASFKDIGLIVLSIAQAPVNMVTQFLDVNVLGVNLFAVFTFIITLSLVVFVIKRVL